MINKEIATILLNATKIISRWAKKGDTTEENQTVLSKRAHEAAWRAVSHLIPVLEHAKESDMYWTRAEIAVETKQSDKEQKRLYSIAKQEDREFMRAKAALDEMISEAVAFEKADPRGLIDKAEAHAMRINRTAAEARNAEELAIRKAIKKAKSDKEKVELGRRYNVSSAQFSQVLDSSNDEVEAVYLKLGLTPPHPSDKFLKAQKAKNKTQKKG